MGGDANPFQWALLPSLVTIYIFVGLLKPFRLQKRAALGGKLGIFFLSSGIRLFLGYAPYIALIELQECMSQYLLPGAGVTRMADLSH